MDADSDGQVESTDTATFGRDRQARTTTTSVTLQSPQGTIVQTRKATYDARGNQVLLETLTDVLDPAATDYRSTVTTSYDGTYVSTQVYDSKDRIVRTEFVSSADGQPTTRQTTELTYDASGRVVTFSVKFFIDGTWRSAQVSTSVYDSKGRPTSYVTQYDEDGDQSTDVTETATNTYDSKGRLVGELFVKRQANGILLSKVTRTTTYTKTTITTTTVSDFDGDGVTDDTVVMTTPA